MCSPTICETCGRTTWTGCGMHAAQVMAGVDPAHRCTCDGREQEGPWT
ncbi:hypothetical protein [Georgenia sp. SUBG003]